jgi:Lysozyme like domain/Excreted virulence factor EspC, type VII ESX diderm
MAQLTAEQLAQHAYTAGFRGDALATAVAVAMAESGGDTRAHNDQPPDNSYGLWQINMIDSLGPARRETFGLGSNNELFNADENAKAAYAISGKGKDFTPWTTYTGGAYEKYLADAREAAGKVSGEKGKDSGKGGGKDGDGGKGKGTDKGKGDDKGKGAGKGDGKGFTVDPEYLTDFAKRAGQVAEELRSVSSKTAQAIRGVAMDSFGKIGSETGFASALGEFGKSLEQRVATIGSNVEKMGSATAKSAQMYRASDDEAISNLNRADIRSVLG